MNDTVATGPLDGGGVDNSGKSDNAGNPGTPASGGRGRADAAAGTPASIDSVGRLDADVLLAHIRDVPDYPKPGVLFKDITPLLADRQALADAVEAMAAPWHTGGAQLTETATPGHGVDKVVGVEARGFILAAPVAVALGVGFVPVRKEGKLPAAINEVSYSLEYGDEVLQIHADALTAGDRVLIVDDVLATGGTVEATARLVRDSGAQVAGVQVLLEVTALGGREGLDAYGLTTLLSS